jgi:dienelactone hydrolase
MTAARSSGIAGMNAWLAVAALLVIAAALWNLHRAGTGTVETRVQIAGTPATIFRPLSASARPVVVIAHGFAGSQPLMRSFALTLARNGYIAVTFDFPGHGRNPEPLTGNITDINGATQVLVAATARVAGFARGLGDGRLAVLGHSMASDIVVRFAQSTPDVAATIAVSMFSPAVTADSPRNLLIIVGAWESRLRQEALRAVGLAIAPAEPKAGVTYGEFAHGTARRAAFSAHVEHVGVLFSQDSLRESVAWLDQTFGMARSGPPVVDSRGPWILALFCAIVLLGRPLAALLPRIAAPAVGAALSWRSLWMPLLIPMIGTPLLLRVLPTHFLPILVGDYLAAHFAMYGLMTLGCLFWRRRLRPAPAKQLAQPVKPSSVAAFAGSVCAVIAYSFVALVWPLDRQVTSFVPGPGRTLLILAMLVGTMLFFLSDEWLTRGEPAPRGAYAASKLAFLASLAIAVALDFQRLFFLIIIIPLILLFFLAYGLLSSWIYRRTGHPLVAGIANAVAFAWAIGVTFPLLA